MVHYEPLQPKRATSEGTISPPTWTCMMQPPRCRKGASLGAQGTVTAPVLSWGWARLACPTSRRACAPRPRLSPAIFDPPDRRYPARADANRRVSRQWAERSGGRGAVPGPPAAAAAAAAPVAGGREVSGGRRGRTGGGRAMEAALNGASPRRGCVWRPAKGGLLPRRAWRCRAALSPLPTPAAGLSAWPLAHLRPRRGMLTGAARHPQGSGSGSGRQGTAWGRWLTRLGSPPGAGWLSPRGTRSPGARAAEGVPSTVGVFLAVTVSSRFSRASETELLSPCWGRSLLALRSEAAHHCCAGRFAGKATH